MPGAVYAHMARNTLLIKSAVMALALLTFVHLLTLYQVQQYSIIKTDSTFCHIPSKSWIGCIIDIDKPTQMSIHILASF